MTSMNMRSVLLPLLLAASAGQASAQTPDGHRRVKVRATLSGSSDTSEAGSYKVYSGVAVDVAIAGDLGSRFAVELAGRIESREVDGPGSEAVAERLGSLVMVPVSLLGQWRPGWGEDSGFRPYAGAGLTATFTFEKSGTLDPVTVPAHVGPTLQIGFDQSLTAGTWLNLDARWGTLRVDLTDLDASAGKVKVDPLVFAIGMGFAF
jgi:outer membrane protein W